MILTLAISAVVMASVALAFVLIAGASHPTGSSTTTANLPSGCKKPANGYLIMATDEGFNDSKLHGAPTNSWPTINVTEGSTVNIVVCNVDITSAHGFQINHYFDSNIESVRPGQVIIVSFIANKAGTFGIYCSIQCPPHIFMQSGALRVMA